MWHHAYKCQNIIDGDSVCLQHYLSVNYCSFLGGGGVGVGCTSQGFNIWHFPLFVRLSHTFVMIQENSESVYHARGWSGGGQTNGNILNDKITLFAAQSHSINVFVYWMCTTFYLSECIEHTCTCSLEQIKTCQE